MFVAEEIFAQGREQSTNCEIIWFNQLKSLKTRLPLIIKNSFTDKVHTQTNKMDTLHSYRRAPRISEKINSTRFFYFNLSFRKTEKWFHRVV